MKVATTVSKIVKYLVSQLSQPDAAWLAERVAECTQAHGFVSLGALNLFRKAALAYADAARLVGVAEGAYAHKLTRIARRMERAAFALARSDARDRALASHSTSPR
jgi:hypothetical protein